jgi:hypothetical protein
MSFVRLALVLCLACPVVAAADLPKDIDPEARAAFIKKLQKVYVAERDKWKAKVEEAEALAKFPATAAEGKKMLAAAKERLAIIEKNPTEWTIPNSPLVLFGDVPAKQGLIGYLNVGGWELIASEVLAEGVLVEGAMKNGDRVKLAHYLIASPFEVPKAKGKKPPAVTLPGLWYVAGSVDVKGKAVPVLYRFELKAEDLKGEKPEKK